jgi:hypothetical protein
VSVLPVLYPYSKGAVGADWSVPIEDAEVDIHPSVLAYLRMLDLWGQSGKFHAPIRLRRGARDAL